VCFVVVVEKWTGPDANFLSCITLKGEISFGMKKVFGAALQYIIRSLS